MVYHCCNVLRMACELFFISLLLTVAACIADNPCNKLKTEYGYVCVCNSTYCDEITPPETLPTGLFHFYYTSDDTPGFNHETGNFKEQVFQSYDFKYTVNSSKHFQTIRGFGGAFTDLFGVEFNKLSYDTQENMIKSFFSEDGIEYTFCRIVLGSSDFSVRHYSYVPNYDPSLESFSLTEDDYIYKIAPIKRALSVTKKGINFLGSTWTAPSWMKINNDPSAGYLKHGYRQLWADYHIKMLDAFKAEGIEFWGLTTGNEPVTLLSVKIVPCLVMFPEQQREWIIKNLGPSLKKANYDTKIIILDDMRVYTIWFMNTIFRDRRAKEFVSGVGLHWYTDLMMSPIVMKEMHKKYPDQEILYTETSINVVINVFVKSTDPNMIAQYFANVKMEDSVIRLGSWGGAIFYANNIIENLNHWVTTYVEWNLGLNLKGGPNLLNSTCDASVLVNETVDEFYKQPTFYVMGHFSKFIQPKSVIIEVHLVTDNSSKFYKTTIVPPVATTKSPFPFFEFRSKIEYVGALNPDGSHSIVFHNPKSSSVDIIVHDPERGYASLVLKAKSINTLVYW